MVILTVISIIVGCASFLVGVVQLLLNVIHDHKDKKIHSVL